MPTAPPLRGVLATIGIAFLLGSLSPEAGSAQGIDANLWVPNGQVSALARSGNTLYIGGSFSQVGPATGSGVPIDSTTGAPIASFPKVAGLVRAVVSDGSGGWYIGGTFTKVGGLARNNVARVLSDYSVSSWDPNADGEVDAIAVSGSTVYLGGVFNNVGNLTKHHIAAVNATTGFASGWNPNANGNVYALAVDGTNVYAGGAFTNIGGQLRQSFAALSASTGTATSLIANANGTVWTLAIADTTLYVGGDFTSFAAASRSRVASLGLTTSVLNAWNPSADAVVIALLPRGSLVYAGGGFSSIGGQTRSRLAALDASTGAASTWDPAPNNSVYALAVSGNKIYAGGFFSTIGGQARSCLAWVDAATGLAGAWNPKASDIVRALSVGLSVYAGGDFQSLGGVARPNIAALDLTTGAATSWNPVVNGSVAALAVAGTSVYVGGNFVQVGAQAHNYIAAVDAVTGNASSWDPQANNPVYALAVSGTTVYAGGDFTQIGGQAAARLAALDAGSGLIQGGWDWFNAGANSSVLSLAVSGSSLYVGGGFSSVGGQTRNGIAEVSSTTGLATAWNPNVQGGTVQAIAVGSSVVYAGGFFTTVGGVTRNRIAAIDRSSGIATAWNPNAGSAVNALVLSGTTIYAAGAFGTIGGQARARLAALDAGSGLPSPWNPSPVANVDAVATDGQRVYAGGPFLYVGSLPQSKLVSVSASPALTNVVPASGGNAGQATVTAYGSGISSASALKLSRSGQPDIFAIGPVSSDGTSMTVTLNLAGVQAGSWDVTVAGPDLQTATIVNGFTVTSVLAPQLRVALVGTTQQAGNPAVRRDRRTAFDLVIENPGDVDATSVPLWLAGIPLDATLTLDFPLSYPPQAGGEPSWSTVPVTFTSAGGKYVPLVMPRVPPGTTTRRLYLTVPGPTHLPFTLTAAITPPWADGNKFRSCIAAGGITNPTCMGPQLDAINAYLSTNASSIVAMSGTAIWAKEAWQCEGAGSLPAALIKAEQVLDYLEAPIEGGGAAAGCEDVLLTRWRDSRTVSVVASVDPNDKLGAQGTLSGRQVLPYSIRFENFATATASAQDVTISDQLSNATMDLTTVSLDRITFGGFQIQPPPGLSSYSAQVDMRPAKNLLVNVSVSLDPFTHVLSWYFNSIDPATGTTPLNTSNGFLTPNHVPPEGEGSVLFTVMPKPGATSISNAASILFDDPPATNTSAWANGIDQSPPASHVLPLSGQSNQPTIMVSWALDAPAPDVRDYTIYVKEDAGPYRVWRLNTTATTDTLKPPPDHHFHNYSFYSVARDQIGNIEAAPASPPDPGATTQSTTEVPAAGPPRLALEGARPNPAATEALTIAFSLPSAEPATLELIDIAGRRLVRLEVGHLGPGSHVVALVPASIPRPGLYFISLLQGGHALRDRVAVVR